MSRELYSELSKVIKDIARQMREYGEIRGLLQAAAINPKLYENEEFKRLLEVYSSE